MRKLKIVFVSLNGVIIADGSRILSAKLKEMGHDVTFVCLLLDADSNYAASEKELKQFSDLIGEKQPDLIMHSFLSDAYLRATEFTQRIYKDHPDIDQMWGGMHCTVSPENSIEVCKIICQGEGDEALPEFINAYAAGEDYTNIANFWFRMPDGSVKSNPMRPLLLNLDSMPWPDYEVETMYVVDNEELVPMTDDLMEKYHNRAPLGFPSYNVLSSRGCAFRCSFCYNATYKKLFRGQKAVRYRSLMDVVDELKFIKERFPWFEGVYFSDDDFFMRKKEELEEFAAAVREKDVTILTEKWWGSFVTPASLSLEKLEIVHSVGYGVLCMGVQTGSEEFNKEVYDRNFPNRLLLRKAKLMDEHFNRKLIVTCDFITDAPGETQEDVLKSLELIDAMPSWFNIVISTYVWYPGSPMYKKAVDEGLISDDPKLYTAKSFQPYQRTNHSYVAHLLIAYGCANYVMPEWVKRFLMSKTMLFIGRHTPQFVLNLVYWKAFYRQLWAYNQAKALGYYRRQPRWWNLWNAFQKKDKPVAQPYTPDPAVLEAAQTEQKEETKETVAAG